MNKNQKKEKYIDSRYNSFDSIYNSVLNTKSMKALR